MHVSGLKRWTASGTVKIRNGFKMTVKLEGYRGW